MEREAKLIEGCRAGDNASRECLYNLYAKQMMAVCYRYTGNADDAHDVLHDGFIKAFTRFNFKGESALSTWLTRIMISEAVDFLRKRKRFAEMTEEIPTDVPDEESEEVADEGWTEQELLQFVAELPAGCRTVFNLHVIDGKSHKEIAEMLGIKEHSSTSQYHRARNLLVQKLNTYKAHGKER